MPFSCYPPPFGSLDDLPWLPLRLLLRLLLRRLLETALLLTWLRSLQIDTILLPMGPHMEPNSGPNSPDFPKCENLDFEALIQFRRVQGSDLNQFPPSDLNQFSTPNLGPTPDMVWGYNLQHMAPFGALTSGFCMVFQPATLIFLTPDPILGAPGQGLGPRRPGGPFWAQNGGPENMILWRDWSPMRFPRIFLRGEWFPWYPGTLWVYQFPPKPSQGGVLQGFPPNPKIPGGPLGPLVGCLLSLCGPLAYCRGRWHGRRPFACRSRQLQGGISSCCVKRRSNHAEV